MAIGGLAALKEAGLAVPGDVSVIGFYDEAFAPFTDPSLSSVSVNWRRVGEVSDVRSFLSLSFMTLSSKRVSVDRAVSGRRLFAAAVPPARGSG